MFDPISITVLGTGILARLFSRSKRNEASAKMRRAHEYCRIAAGNCESQRALTVGEINHLAVERAACIHWQIPQICLELREAGLSAPVKLKEFGLFGGRTLDQLLKLGAKVASAMLVPLRGAIDNTVLATSAAALLVRGIQGLDGLHVVSVPVLHDTIGHAISSLPFEHAGDVAHVLGSVGDLGVAEALGDALGIFSIVRVCYNLSKSRQLNARADELWTYASELQKHQACLLQVAVQSQHLRAELSQNSYETFKWILFSQEIRKTQRRNRRQRAAQAPERLIEAIRALWLNLEQSAGV